LGAIVALLIASSFWLIVASPGIAELAGSKHDFTTAEWSGGDSCQPCHVPHRADQTKMPKWGGPSTIRSDPPADRGRPGPLSRMCLSCHDGNTARDTFGDETGGMPLPARSRIAADGDLRNDHPVGARYPTGDRKFQPLSRVEQFDRIRLFDGKVECSSCHDPHDSYDQPYLLVMPNDESQLCMSCHRL
jgi:predicted CXXCH cytochrome family protein